MVAAEDESAIGDEELGDEYPVGEEEGDAMMAELTLEELKEVFRLFDYEKIGFLSLPTFGSILRELDDDWTEEDINGILADIDCDSSGSIDFNEFVKIMTY